MALFSNKIIDARYMNAEYSIVEILYTHDDGLVYSHALEVDENSSDWKDLQAEGWSGEKLIESTTEYKRAQSHAYNLQVNESARKIAQEMLGMKALQDERDRLVSEKNKLDRQFHEKEQEVNEKEQEVNEKEQVLVDLDKEVKFKANRIDNSFFAHLWEINESKDELFKFKLWALEQECVKTASKEIKSSIRKAKKITQGIAIVDSII